MNPSKLPAIPGYDIEAERFRDARRVVYRATTASDGDPVRIEVFLATAQDEMAQSRFVTLNEDLMAGCHRHLAPLREVGIHEGRPFLVSDWMERTLADWLRHGPLAPSTTAGLIETLARTLAELRLVHGNLSPASVLVDANNVPHLTGFCLLPDSSHRQAADVARLAPEQLRGDADPSIQSDVWALGLLLYECLTGRLPFQSSSVRELTRQILETEPIAPHRLDATIPVDLEDLCLRCLSRDPQQRPRDPGALAAALSQCDMRPVPAQPVRATPPPAKSRLTMSVWVILALSLWAVLATVFALARLGSSTPRPVEPDGTLAELRHQLRCRETELTASRLQRIDETLTAGNHPQARKILDDFAPDDRGPEFHYLTNRLIQERPRTFVLHTGMDTQLTFAAGDRYLLAHGGNGYRLIDLHESKDTAMHLAMGAATGCVSPEGTSLVVAVSAANRPAQVWLMNPNGGAKIRELPSPKGSVRALAFDATGSRLAIGGSSKDEKTGVVLLVDPQTDQIQRTLEPPSPVMSLAFSRDGDRLAVGCTDQGVRVWNLKREAEPLSLTGLFQQPTQLVFSSDGQHLFGTGGTGDARAARVWAFPQFAQSHDFVGRGAFRYTGDDLVWGGRRVGIGAWHILSGRDWQQLPGPSESVQTLAITANGRYLASASGNSQDDRPTSEIKIWHLEDRREVKSLGRIPGPVTSLAFSPTGQVLAGVDGGGILRVWGVERWTPEAHPVRFDTPLAFHPDGSQVFGTDRLAGAVLWEVATGKTTPVRAELVHPRHAVWSPDGRRLLIVDSVFGAAVWDARAGRVIRTFTVEKQVYGLAISHDGTRAVTVGDDCVVWNLDTGGPIATLEGNLENARVAAFSPDGKRVIVGGGDAIGHVYEVETGQLKSVLMGHRNGGIGGITLVAFTPEGNRALTAGADGTFRTWNPTTAQQLSSVEAKPVGPVRFSADSRRFYARSGPQVALWDTETGVRLLEFPGHPSQAVSDFVVTQNETTLWTATHSDTVRRFDLKPRPLPPIR